jgi:hypothetical protein
VNPPCCVGEVGRIEWDELSGKLRGVVLEVAELLLPSEVQDVWEYVDYDEPGLAFETLCSQLHEHGSVVSAEVVGRLAEIGAAMGLEPRQWEILRVVD